jgi:hypothetical protein
LAHGGFLHCGYEWRFTANRAERRYKTSLALPVKVPICKRENGDAMASCVVIFAGLWAAVVALGPSAQAQNLGVWQGAADGRIASGEPVLDAPIVLADPVRALPPVVNTQHSAGGSSVRPVIISGKMAGLPAQHASVSDLMKRNYDPNSPLPHPDLAEMAKLDPQREVTRPYLHVQPEEHGGIFGMNGVFGLTVPFPTSRAGNP